jgi:hypothetical protein
MCEKVLSNSTEKIKIGLHMSRFKDQKSNLFPPVSVFVEMFAEVFFGEIELHKSS